MEELSTTVNGRMFTFKKLSAVDMLKVQQTLLRKAKIDSDFLAMVKNCFALFHEINKLSSDIVEKPSTSLGEDGLADDSRLKELEEKQSEIMIYIFMTCSQLVQSFEEDELINFMNTVISKAMVMRLTESGHKRLANIDEDFVNNCNGIYELIFSVLKENYNFDFFLKKVTTEEKTANTIKVQRGSNS